MLAKGEPKWRRRKEARPAEIAAAAFAVFSEKGFAGARLDEVAARAGVSKGALYLYFETKEALFQAVIRETVAPRLAAVRTFAESFQGPFAELVRVLLPQAAAMISAAGLGRLAKVVIGESRTTPELARFWYEEVVSPMLATVSGLIERAQARGELRPGAPRTHAFSLIGPLMLGVLWRETFEPVGAEPVDLEAVARQHVETVLQGMLVSGAEGGR